MNKAIVFLILISISTINFAQNGVLDPSFGNAGTVLTSIGATDRGHSIAKQADGKLLVTAFHQNTPNMLALLRYNLDGTLDASFDTDGMVTISFNVSSQSSSTSNYSIAVQADGKILVGGDSQGNTTVDFTVFRFNTNGSLDTGFDTDGKVQINFGAFNSSSATAISIQSDGKILLSGHTSSSGNSDFAVVRLTTNGSLDTSFDADGKVVIPVGDFEDRSYAMAIQTDGKIIIGGSALGNIITDFALIRLNTNGSLDTSFDADGKVITPFNTNGNQIKDIQIQSDGKIIVTGISYGTISGSYSNNFALARYTVDGNLDTSFGVEGKVLTNITANTNNAVSNAILLQADGKIICGGNYYNALGIFELAMVRYNSDGSLDETFGTSGVTTTSLEDGAFGNDITFQIDGKIVLVGNSVNNVTNKTSIVLARYTSGIVLSLDQQTVFKNDILVYPNPSKDLIQLDFSLNVPAELDFILTDILGNEITQLANNVTFGVGKQNYSLNIPSVLPSGIYFLKIYLPSSAQTIRFIHTK